MTTALDQSDFLQPSPFYKKMINSVSHLSCGDDFDGQRATEWLHGIGWPSVIQEINRGTSVWLYRNRRDEIVGFGSLGKDSWSFDGVPTAVQFIPRIGVFAEHQGHPHEDTGATKYCYQILNHILDEAERRIEISAWVGLSVRLANQKAIHVYNRVGFAWVENERGLSRMLLRLKT